MSGTLGYYKNLIGQRSKTGSFLTSCYVSARKVPK